MVPSGSFAASASSKVENTQVAGIFTCNRRKIHKNTNSLACLYGGQVTVDGRKSGVHQLRLVVYSIIYKVLYIPGGAGFRPSTGLPTQTIHGCFQSKLLFVLFDSPKMGNFMTPVVLTWFAKC